MLIIENLKYNLELLYELQKCDINIHELKKEIDKIPYKILEIEKKLEYKIKKNDLNVKKENFVKLNLLKKEKESLLDLDEKKINKYTAELNTIKSNDIYKSLLFEIEKIKENKNILENEVLELMEKIDNEETEIKNNEFELKEIEQKLENEICKVKDFKEELKKKIIEKEIERENQKSKIDKSVLYQYEKLHVCGHNEKIICIINDESCDSCGMLLRPQLINQAQKCHELVFCDNCSGILLKK
ncbi:MAG: hypothetical protein LBH27_00160 [Endomicrobium sp.]|jgi:predicted  nucleic acid-binding Zn-ribbon protein|nr:hypothetical protein [Endomicrobium sp.]